MAEPSTGKIMSVPFIYGGMESIRGFGYGALYLCLILNAAYIQAVDNKAINCSRERKETQLVQLNQSYGMLHTPNYPGNYFSNQHILWQIKPPHQWPVTVKIHGFRLEEHSSCSYDKMTILDSESCSVLFGPTCGVIKPQILNLNSTSVLIDFSSDGSGTYQGFLMTFWISPLLGTAIKHTVEGNEGTIMSPLYASNLGYPTDVTVIWSLKVPAGMIIILDFMDFRLEPSGLKCENDYLAVRDGPHSNSSLLGKYCGIQQAFTLCSTTSSFTLELSSDSTNTEQGFLAHFNSERPENFQIVGLIPTLITPIGTFNATTPTYITSAFHIYIWQIHVPIQNQIQLQWAFAGNARKSSFFLIKERSVTSSQSATYLEIDVNVLKQVKALHPLWLRNLLFSKNMSMISSGKQWNSSGNIILIAFGSIGSTASSFSGEYRMIKEVSHIDSDRCVGPSHELSLVNKSTIFQMQLLSKQQGASAMVRCKWTFKSKLHHSIKMEVLSIKNNFGNTETCDNGGIIFYENSTNNSKRYGPYCRVTDRQPIPQIYTPTVSVFVSESSTLSVILYGYSGMDIKVQISQAYCQGVVPQLKHDIGLNGMNYNWTLDPNSQPICYHVNGFALPLSYNLTFDIPDASALSLIINRSESAVKENCHNQLLVTGCNISTVLVPQMTSLKLPCNSHMPKSIQVRSINTCPSTKSFWYFELNSKINVDCQLQHPNCTDIIGGVCGKILIPLSGLLTDMQIIPNECFIEIHSIRKEHPFSSLTYYELTFKSYNLEGCKTKEVRVEEKIIRSRYSSYGSSSVIKHSFSACDLKDRYKIIRTMTADGVKISVYKDNGRTSNKGDIYVEFSTLIHHFHQLPKLDHLCPKGFRYMKRQCYFYQEPDVQNKIEGYTGTWMDANAACKNINASLLSITNQEEMLTIKELMSSVWAKDMFNYPAIYVYIGLHDTIEVSIGLLQKVMKIIQLKEFNGNIRAGLFQTTTLKTSCQRRLITLKSKKILVSLKL